MMHFESQACFWGWLFLLCGVAICGALILENWKIKWHVWDTSEHIWAVSGGFSVIVGILFFLFTCSCGANQLEPADPVHVEVIVCEPTLGTAGQYYKLSSWCREIAFCAIAMPEIQGERETIRNTAEYYARELDREFNEYHTAGRTDCYCGPICQEAMSFIEMAKNNGLLCRS